MPEHYVQEFKIGGENVVIVDGKLYAELKPTTAEKSPPPDIKPKKKYGKKRTFPKLADPEITEEEAEALQPESKRTRTTITPDLHDKIQLLKKSGMNSAAIAKELLISLSAVNNHWN